MRRLLVVTTVAVALGGAPAALAQQSPPPERTLGAQGRGELELAPDVGTFRAVVRRTSPTSRGARDATNRRLAATCRACVR